MELVTGPVSVASLSLQPDESRDQSRIAAGAHTQRTAAGPNRRTTSPVIPKNFPVLLFREDSSAVVRSP